MAATPVIPKIAIFTLATTDFSDDVTDVRVVPTPGAEQAVTTLDGVVHQDVAAEAWALEIEMVQDWDSARPGLAYYLFNNKGTSVAFVYKPTIGAVSAAVPSAAGTVKLVPSAYGGKAGEFALNTIRLPITGDPVFDHTP